MDIEKKSLESKPNQQKDETIEPKKKTNTNSSDFQEKDLSFNHRDHLANIGKVDNSADPQYIKYVQTVERSLQSFEYVTEWADITAFLSKLSRVFESFEIYSTIPEKETVAKRLAQCLNPALPTGVHQKALKMYEQIFTKVGLDQLVPDLNLYAMGLYPYVRNASITTKEQSVDILKTFFLPIVTKNLDYLAHFLVAILSGMEEEKSSISSKCLSILRIVEEKVDRDIFFKTLFYVLSSSPIDRAETLKLLSVRLPVMDSPQQIDEIFGHNANLITGGLCSSLQDESVMTVRAALDLLVLKFPLDKNALPENYYVELVRYSIQILLRKDMSLNRRLYMWWLGGSDDSKKQLEHFVENSLCFVVTMFKNWFSTISKNEFEYKELLIPFRILVALMDKHDIARHVLNQIFLTLLETLKSKHENSIKENIKIDNRTQQTIRNFFEMVNPHFLWSQLSLLSFRNIPEYKDLNSANLGKKIKRFESDIMTYSLFMDVYIPDTNGKTSNIHMLMQFLMLLSISRHISQYGSVLGLAQEVHHTLKIAVVIFMRISLKSLEYKDGFANNIMDIDYENFDSMDYVQNYYFGNEQTRKQKDIENFSSFPKTVQHKKDVKETKQQSEIVLIISSINILKSLIKDAPTSNLLPIGFEDACQLLQQLVYYVVSTVMEEISTNTKLGKNQSSCYNQHCMVDQNTDYIHSLLYIASFSKNFQIVKCAIDTIIRLMKLKYSIKKPLLLNKVSILSTSDLQIPAGTRKKTNILGMITYNLWGFVGQPASNDAVLYIELLSEIYGEKTMITLIDQAMKNSNKLSGLEVQAFFDFWQLIYINNESSVQNIEDTNQNDSPKKSQLFNKAVISTKSNFPYFPLLISCLTTSFSLFDNTNLLRMAEHNAYNLFGNVLNHKLKGKIYANTALNRVAENNIEIILLPLLQAIHLFINQLVHHSRSYRLSDNSLNGAIYQDKIFSFNFEPVLLYLQLIKKIISMFPQSAEKFLASSWIDYGWVLYKENETYNSNLKGGGIATLKKDTKHIVNQVDPNILFDGHLNFFERFGLIEDKNYKSKAPETWLEASISLVSALINMEYILCNSKESGFRTENKKTTDTKNQQNPNVSNTEKNLLVGKAHLINFQNPQTLDVKIAAFSLLDVLITPKIDCSKVAISFNSCVLVLDSAIRLLMEPENNLTFKESKLKLQTHSRAYSVISKLSGFVSNPCKCTSCNKESSENTHINILDRLERLFVNLTGSEIFANSFIYSFPVISLPKAFNEPDFVTICKLWGNVSWTLCRILNNYFRKAASKKIGNNLTDSKPMRAFTFLILKIAPTLLQSINNLVLNHGLKLCENGFERVYESNSEIFIIVINIYSAAVGLVLSYIHIMPTMHLKFDKTPSIRLIESLKSYFKVQNKESKAEGYDSVTKNIQEIVENQGRGSSFLLKDFVHIFSSIWELNEFRILQNSTKDKKETQFLSLDHKKVHKIFAQGSINIKKTLSSCFNNLWNINASELALAIASSFEGNCGMWTFLLFEPLDYTKLALLCEDDSYSEPASNYSTLDGYSPRKSNTQYHRRNTNSSWSTSVLGQKSDFSDAHTLLSNKEFRMYTELIEQENQFENILKSFSFLDIFEPSEEKHSNNNFSINELKLKKDLQMVTNLMFHATSRIKHHINRNNKNIAHMGNEGGLILSNPGHSLFSNLSDIGILRAIELLLETRVLDIIGCRTYSLFNKSSEQAIENCWTGFNNKFSIEMAMKAGILDFSSSVLSLIKLLDSPEVIEKPWLPFFLRTCVSSVRLLTLFVPRKNFGDGPNKVVDTNASTLIMFRDQSESVFSKNIEKVILYLGKLVSGFHWLNRKGKLPSAWELLESRKNLEFSEVGKTSSNIKSRDYVFPGVGRESSYANFSFSGMEMDCKSGVSCEDSALLFVYRASGFQDPLFYWNRDDVIEQILIVLATNVLPNLNYIFSSNSHLQTSIALFVSNVVNPLSRDLVLETHASCFSNYLEDLISSSNESPEKYTNGVSILSENLTNGNVNFKENSSGDLEILENPSLRNITGIDVSNLSRNFISNCSDQPSRIYILILDSMVALGLHTNFAKPLFRAVWDHYNDNKFFTLQRTAFSPFPLNKEFGDTEKQSNQNNSSNLNQKQVLPNTFVTAALSSSAIRWRVLLQMCASNDREKFSELLLKLGSSSTTTLFTSKAQEAMQKAYTLRRITTLIWAGQHDQYLSSFPTIQERLVELIKNHSYKNMISEIYLCLRVILCRMGSGRLSSMWPVIITETSKIILSYFLLNKKGVDKDDFASANVLLACCKFLDLLMVLNPSDFMIHSSVFISTDIRKSRYSENEELERVYSREKSGSSYLSSSVANYMSTAELKASFESSSNYTGLLDQLGKHFSVLSQGLEFKTSSPVDKDVDFGNNMLDICLEADKNDMDNDSSHNDLYCGTKDSVRFRDLLLTMPYIQSPLDLTQFLNKASNNSYNMTVIGIQPDFSLIEAVLEQDLMVFYDFSATTSLPNKEKHKHDIDMNINTKLGLSNNIENHGNSAISGSSVGSFGTFN
ncbi:hypothetical protein BB558_000033 [Smittium angustum]|uniref:Uncharacterized protein n=1 Tax=Smittium angustum TaxID=133377 RepID=A0A2U1JFA0_SMIAN|nr:hypothetical protein BB558_000033 [Smittium angustum]